MADLSSEVVTISTPDTIGLFESTLTLWTRHAKLATECNLEIELTRVGSSRVVLFRKLFASLSTEYVKTVDRRE